MSEKRMLDGTLKEIQESSDKNAVGLVNSLFMTSTSHVLDKVCLNIFSKLGDTESLQLLYRKYPSPENISISLLPYYIRVLRYLGGVKEIELLARITTAFWGLYRTDIIAAFEDITARTGSVDVPDVVAEALRHLYDDGDADERKRVLRLCSRVSHQLLLSVLLCGIDSPDPDIRREAVQVLGTWTGLVATLAMRRAMQDETEDDVLSAYDAWLDAVSGGDTSSAVSIH